MKPTQNTLGRGLKSLIGESKIQDTSYMPDLDIEDPHHHHHHQANSEQHDPNNDDLQPNPNRPVNHIDNTDDDQSTNINRTVPENRAEASAW